MGTMNNLKALSIGILAIGFFSLTPAVLLADGLTSLDSGLPVPTHTVRPYAPELVEFGIRGDVAVVFRLSEDGKPRDIVVESASHSIYSEAVVKALRGWRFEVPVDAEADALYRLPFKFHTP